ncbi:MAG TPA: cytochrome d ubiquinol oxidase subunit II [Mycobacteriales bacterium]|nr:cytochrome d ubiquinol oxidase subunit II [Mycobacteriales bacterium]
MSENILLIILVLGLTTYTVLGGADFGAGFWDLTTRGKHADAERRLIANSIGPVWEANHVWLIFVIVTLFSGFPEAFGLISTSLEVPLFLTLLGIVLRGAGYVYRAYGDGAAGPGHWWGHVFAVASIVTPFMLGASGASLASGRLSTWAPLTQPLPLLAGILAVAATAFLAAVYLCHDAADAPGAERFRMRALSAAIVAGAVSLALLPLLQRDAPIVWDRFTQRGWPFVAGSVAAGVATLVLLWHRRYVPARISAAGTVGFVLWGWAAALYPDVAAGRLSASAAAAPAANQQALAIVLVAGLALLAPAVVLLLRVFSRDPEPM